MMDLNAILNNDAALLVLLALWVLPWKAVALWKAARLSHKGWFVAIFVINSLAIIDIIYIFLIASKYKVEATEVEDVPSGEEGR